MNPNGPNMGYGPLPGGYAPGGDASKRKKLAIGFVVGMVLLIGMFGLMLLRGGSDSTKETLINLAVAQNEALRISEDYAKDLKDQATKNRDAELTATLTTNSMALNAELKRAYKVKSIPSSKQRAAVDTAADERLTSSIRLDRLDKDYTEVITEKLGEQLDLIQQAQSEVKSKKTKEILSEIATSTSELEQRFRAASNKE